MAEQKINKRRVNPREAIREGLNNSIGGALFGNSPISGLKNAIIRGARSNAAVAAINNIFDSFTPTEQDRIHDFMRNLPPGTTLVLELPGMRDDPRNECGGRSPFHDGVGYALPSATGRYNSDTNGGRKGFSLVDFLKDVAAGAVLGGLSGAVYYGGGKAVEAVKKSIPRPDYEGSLSLVYGDDWIIHASQKFAPKTTDQRFVVIAHGSPYKMQIKKGVEVPAWEIAKRIRQTEGYVGGKQIIRLYSCNTGSKKDGFAQQLADILNVTVEAPNRYIYPTKQGGFTICTKYIFMNKEYYRRGNWVTFNPNVKIFTK